MSEMLANRYFMTGRYELAGPILEQLAGGNRGTPELRQKLVLCYLKTNRSDEALALILDVLRDMGDAHGPSGDTTPGAAGLLAGIEQLLQEHGDRPDARSVLTELARLKQSFSSEG